MVNCRILLIDYKRLFLVNVIFRRGIVPATPSVPKIYWIRGNPDLPVVVAMLHGIAESRPPNAPVKDS